jgi:radical SAM protein with 4Fe4S-binding SPASM domain
MSNRLIKPANAIKSGYSYLKSLYTGNARVSGMPVSVGVELTNICNLHCPECLSGSGQMKRERGFMEIELFKKVMKELAPYLYNVNLYFQGEPMLHPLFFLFLRNSLNTNSVVSTNGHFLSQENSESIVRSGLSKIIISLDGLDQESYESYRINGKVNTVLDGIKNIAGAKKRAGSDLKFEIQFLVNRFNEDQIPLVRKFAKSVQAELSMKSMQVIDMADAGKWLPLNEKFRRYSLIEGEYVSKNPLPDRCPRLWFNPVITWDGKVIPCCFDKNAHHVMGDLNTDSFRDIWDGPRYRIFRKRVLTGRSTIDICRNCTSGLRGVKY